MGVFKQECWMMTPPPCFRELTPIAVSPANLGAKLGNQLFKELLTADMKHTRWRGTEDPDGSGRTARWATERDRGFLILALGAKLILFSQWLISFLFTNHFFFTNSFLICFIFLLLSLFIYNRANHISTKCKKLIESQMKPYMLLWWRDLHC